MKETISPHDGAQDIIQEKGISEESIKHIKIKCDSLNEALFRINRLKKHYNFLSITLNYDGGSK